MRERERERERKREGRYELKRGKGNNNEQYTPLEAADSKEKAALGAASGVGWALTWSKREKEKRNKITQEENIRETRK